MNSFPPTLDHPSGETMVLDRRRLLISFHEEKSVEFLVSALRSLSLAIEGSVEQTGPTGPSEVHSQAEIINHTERDFWIVTANGEVLADEDIERLHEALPQIGPIDWIGPVYKLDREDAKGGICPIPDVLLVQPREGASAEFAGVLRKYGMEEDSKKSAYLGSLRYFKILNPRVRSSIEMRKELLTAENDVVVEVFFEHMPMIVPIAVGSTDPLFGRQWNMRRITAGEDGVMTAWDISTGDPLVVICILDTGVDQAHPDLALAGPGIELRTMGAPGSPAVGVHEGHGTCCAGVAAARFNNGTGLSGVAGNCRILPVAFRRWTEVEVATGIRWATANGARVISMSFGAYAPGEVPGDAGWNFSIIDPAITEAARAGVVVVASTGNDGLTINKYPARHRDVIAVGASDETDARKSLASPDGEFWASNFGPGVSVMAPGVRLPTTDIRGTGGYNSAGDYDFLFGGTSGAAPHVAGVAALLLSRFPSLSNTEVRMIIERTADKVGPAPYSFGFPNGSRNNEMGYGRVNAYRALEYAEQYCTPTVGQIVFSEGVYGLDRPRAGERADLWINVTNRRYPTRVTYSWSVIRGGATPDGSSSGSTFSVILPPERFDGSVDEVEVSVEVRIELVGTPRSISVTRRRAFTPMNFAQYQLGILAWELRSAEFRAYPYDEIRPFPDPRLANQVTLDQIGKAAWSVIQRYGAQGIRAFVEEIYQEPRGASTAQPSLEEPHPM